MLLQKENKNKPAITTKNILNGLEPITRVIYDPDGDWQFFSNTIRCRLRFQGNFDQASNGP